MYIGHTKITTKSSIQATGCEYKALKIQNRGEIESQNARKYYLDQKY